MCVSEGAHCPRTMLLSHVLGTSVPSEDPPQVSRGGGGNEGGIGMGRPAAWNKGDMQTGAKLALEGQAWQDSHSPLHGTTGGPELFLLR